MADFLRPEARAALWRWREVLVAGAVGALAVWWLSTFVTPVRWIGLVIAAGAAGLLVTGLQRARFRAEGQGPGVVQIVERRLSYFGPLTGGVVDLEDVTRLEMEPSALPAPHWVLSTIYGDTLAIPINADGADGLFDVFASLPGIRTNRLLDALGRTPDARVTLWERARPVLH